MDRDARIKRLYFRSWHRGCKETDAVLGWFADEYLRTLDEDGLAAYEELLDEDDADIWRWLTAKTAPRPQYQPLIALMGTKWIKDRES